MGGLLNLYRCFIDSYLVTFIILLKCSLAQLKESVTLFVTIKFPSSKLFFHVLDILSLIHACLANRIVCDISWPEPFVLYPNKSKQSLFSAFPASSHRMITAFLAEMLQQKKNVMEVIYQ